MPIRQAVSTVKPKPAGSTTRPKPAAITSPAIKTSSKGNVAARGTWTLRPELTQKNGEPTPKRPWVTIFALQQSGGGQSWLMQFEADNDQSQVGTRYSGTYRGDPITYCNRVPMLAKDANGNGKFDISDIKPLFVEFFNRDKMTPSIQNQLNRFTSAGFSAGTWTVFNDNTLSLAMGSQNSGLVPIAPGLF